MILILNANVGAHKYMKRKVGAEFCMRLTEFLSCFELRSIV